MATPDKIAQWSWRDHWNRDIEEALSELEREAQVRSRCMDRWVTECKVSYIDARDRQERLLSSIRHLREYQSILGRAAAAESLTADTLPEEP
jgi:hypothetical protein